MNLDKLSLKRRGLLKLAGASLAGGALSGCESQPVTQSPPGIEGLNGRRVLPWQNWSGNQACQPTLKQVPRSTEDLIQAVRSAPQSIRCVGSGHSFSALVPTDQTLMSLARLSGITHIDSQKKQVKVRAGTKLSELGEPLWQQGLSMINMPDINTQSVGGALATSTHGTGMTLGSLSTQMTALELVTAHGGVLTASPQTNADLYYAGGNHLGALGVMSQVTLQTRDAYYLKEKTWMLPLNEGLAQAQQLRDSHRHFEMYALPHADYILMITLDEIDQSEHQAQTAKTGNGDAYETFRTLAKVTDLLPFMRSFIINRGAASVEPESRTGPSHHIFGNLRDIRFNEMEYAVPAEQGLQCLQEILHAIKQHDINVIFPLEYRYVKGDDFWLSPFYQRDSAAISCHNFHDKDYKHYFAVIEPILQKYQGRPHWGKIHTLSSKALAACYPKWQDFVALRQSLDPRGLFLNPHLKNSFGIKA